MPSLRYSTNNIQIILYDNGGNGDIKKYQHEPRLYGSGILQEIKVIGAGQNIGLNAALNECAKVATGDYFYLCHTDMVLLPNWDKALLEASKNLAPGSYLFCSRSIEKTSHTPFHILKDFGISVESFREKELLEFYANYKDKGIVTGYRMPFFSHKKLLNKLTEYNIKNSICDGPFDNSFWSYATDNDLFFNCYEIGVRKFWLIQSSVIYHLSGQSNKQQNVDKDDKMPYVKLCDKWKKFNVSMNIDQSEQKLIPWNLKIK